MRCATTHGLQLHPHQQAFSWVVCAAQAMLGEARRLVTEKARAAGMGGAAAEAKWADTKVMYTALYGLGLSLYLHYITLQYIILPYM